MGETFTIIVTYNGAHWIRNCLNSLVDDIPCNQIIIIDNCSQDNTCSIISDEYASCILIKQNENLGFGMANNLGINYALSEGAEFILLLNQDAWLEKGALSNMQNCLLANPSLGILSPKHFQASGDQLDFLFSTYLDNLIETQGELMIVPFVNAAIWLLPRKTMEIVGGFDPVFPHYGEDVDFVNRCRYHGLSIGILSNQKGYHDRDSSSVPPIAKRKYFEYINALVELKNIRTKISKPLIYFNIRTLRYFISSLLRGNWGIAKTDLANLFKVWRSLSKIRRHRKLSRNRNAPFLKLQ